MIANPLFPAALTALALGILLFLLWDVLAHAVEPVEEALDGAVDGGGWATSSASPRFLPEAWPGG